MTVDAPRVIVTNDDGITSPGLRALAATLSRDFDVVVAAPADDMSGSGTGIGRFEMDRGVRMTPTEIDEAPAAFVIDGPPGLAVTAAALGAFGPKPDMVVSGVNAGINTGRSIIHSGTVGAALTGHTFEMKGLAVSLDQSDPWHWDTAARFARGASHWLIRQSSGPQVLNVNVPALPADEVMGVHWADLDEFGYIRVATHDVEGERLQFVMRAKENPSDPASDTVLCSEGYVTITPLRTIEPAAFPDVGASAVFDSIPSDVPV